MDQMRADKFKFINEAMASHKIEETNSEYNASFLSEGAANRNLRSSSAKMQEQYRKSIDNRNAVEEVDEEEDEEGESSNREKQ